MTARISFILLALALLVKGHLLIARPWFLSWGATGAELAATLPSDELVPHAANATTRAITIHAPASRVWAWVAQTGQDRGGFYSYDVLEDLVGCDMPRIEALRPELQHWKLGDKLWMYPPRKLNGVGGAPLRVLQEGRVLGFATRQIGTPMSAPEDASWSFIIQPRGPDSTRLIARGRGPAPSGVLSSMINLLIFEPAHFVMERRMLIGIAALSEGRRIPAWVDLLQVVCWTLTLTVFIASALLVLRRRQPVRRWFAFVGAGIVFELLTLTQPPWALALGLVGTLLVATFLPVEHARKSQVTQREAISHA